MKFILASGSERRKELLSQIGINFTVYKPQVDETIPKHIKAKNASAFLAQLKLSASLAELAELNYKLTPSKKLMNDVIAVLCADTVIVHKKKVYGKAYNNRKAQEFLKEFSGKTHTVYTSIALFIPEKHDLKKKSKKDTASKIVLKTVKTKVSFAKLSKKDIQAYINTGEWKDAAGAYKIQGKGGCLIKSIKGSYSNVVGLPLFELYAILRKEGLVY